MMKRLIVLVSLGLAVAGVGAASAQPAAICRDCRELANQLRTLRRTHADIADRLAKARAAQSDLQVTQAMDLVDLDKAAALPQTSVANRDRLASAQRRVNQDTEALNRWQDQIDALETRLREINGRIAGLSRELNSCGRGCALAPPGTPPQPPEVVDEAVPEAACERCRPIVEHIRQLQARRREVLRQLTEAEANMDRFDAAIDDFLNRARAVEESGGSISSVTAGGQTMDMGQFGEWMFNTGMDLNDALMRLQDQWRDLDRQIQEELSKLGECNKKCTTATETGSLFPKGSLYYVLGGAVGGGLLIAGAGGEAPPPTASQPVTPPTTVAPPAAAPPTPTPTTPAPTPEPAPQPRISAAGSYKCSSCAPMTDSGGHNRVINLCPQLLADFSVSDEPMTMSHPLPFVSMTGSLNTMTGSFTASGSGTVAGVPNVSVRGIGMLEPSTGIMRFTYTMGANGELPGGQPITYSISIEKKK